MSRELCVTTPQKLMDSMNYTNHLDNSESSNVLCIAAFPEEFVWSTSEHVRLRALQVYLIRSVVERYGGSVDVNLLTGAIQVDVPIDQQGACAEEIEKKMGAICV